MAGPIRVRLACDRCHAQKLRCPKQAGTAVCVRCARAGAACVFSPPGKGLSGVREAAATPLPSAATPSMDADVAAGDGNFMNELFGAAGLDWPTMYEEMGVDPAFGPMTTGCETGPGMGASQNGTPFVNSANGQTSPREGQASAQTNSSSSSTLGADNSTVPSSTQCLSELLRDLDSVLGKLPPEGTLHITYDDTFEQELVSFTQKQDYKIVLEQVFRSSQNLVELYPKAIAEALSPGNMSTPCEVPNCVHRMPGLGDLVELDELLQRHRAERVDVALATLLMSCHFRFLDMLDTVFACLISCVKVTMASPGLVEPEFNLPEVRIGSFVPPKASTMMMQALLLRHLLSGLGKGVEQLSRALEEAKSNRSEREVRVLTLQCELLKEKHDSREQKCQDVAAALVKLGMMK